MMTPQDPHAYTLAERRAIVMEARRAAKELLRKIEILAAMDEVPHANVAQEGTQGDGHSGGGRI